MSRATRRFTTADERDSGQLMLIGAVALAFVIVGLVVVVNTALVGGGGGAAPAVESSETVEFNDQVRQDVRETTIRVNQAAVYDDRSDLTAAMEANVSTYSDLMAESYATGAPTSVSVEYNYAERNGTRVVQAADGSFTRDGTPTSSPDWSPFAPPSDDTLRWFVLNIDAKNVSSAQPVEIVAVNDESETARIQIQRNTSPKRQVLAVDVRTDLPGTANDNAVVCSASDGRVLLNILAGESLGTCYKMNNSDKQQPNLLGPFDGPYQVVEFRDGHQAAGKWSLVAAEPDNSLSQCGPSPTEPCNTPVVLEANVTTTYATEGLRYENTQNVTIYNESR